MTNKHLLNTETKREMTYHEWLDIWLEVYNLPLYAHSTYLSRMYSTRTLKANIEDKNLSMYSNIELQMLINKLFDKGYSKATLIKMNTIIKRSFMQAKKDKFPL